MCHSFWADAELQGCGRGNLKRPWEQNFGAHNLMWKKEEKYLDIASDSSIATYGKQSLFSFSLFFHSLL